MTPAPSPAPVSSQQVFISYGRADALEFAKRLAEDLCAHGHGIFLDLTDIDKGGAFEVRIERGIRQSNVVAAIMTRHSLREESVCRDEVVFALNEGKRLLPLRADPDPAFKPSLLLARRNWIDFTESYAAGLDALLRYLAGDESSVRPPRLPTVTGVNPIDFGIEIARHSTSFVGRKWLSQEIDRWLEESDKRSFVIIGEPGIGKSAMAAWLSIDRDHQVVGIHFCTTQNTRSLNPYEFTACIVAQLHAKVAGFAEAVEEKHPEVRRPTASDAFRELVVEPARSLPDRPDPLLIIVDSLDEALTQQDETVLDVLTWQTADLPAWLRVVMTTRPEEPVLQRVRNLNPFEILANRPENLEDLSVFVEIQLAAPTLRQRVGSEWEKVVGKLMTLSQGNFLCVRMALDALREGTLDVTGLERLSPGLDAFYSDAFERRFKDIERYSGFYLPLLRLLAAAQAPLPFNLLERLSNEPAETLNRRLRVLRPYLRVIREGNSTSYVIFHKSLIEWLTERETAGDHYCDPLAGHIRFADELTAVRQDDGYALRHLPFHLIKAGRWDDLTDVLTDLSYIEGKCAAGMTHDLVADYRAAIEALPEAQQENRQKREREERVRHYTRELIACAKAWSDARDRHAADPVRFPMPEPQEIPLPVIPLVKPWTDEQIEADSERIAKNPTRLDRMRAFGTFVNTEAHNLSKFVAQPRFCMQQASNHADSGPVAEAARTQLDKTPATPMPLLSPTSLPGYNPHPACLRTLEGHSDSVKAVAITPDGRLAISGGDGTLRVWEVESGRSLRTLKGHSDWVRAVAITPDGRLAISGGDDHALRVWEVENGRSLRILEGHSRSVNAVALTPDGHLAISGSNDNTLRVWEVESGRCLAVLAVSTPVLESRIKGMRVALGGLNGSVYFSHLHQVEEGIPFVTPRRLRRHGKDKTTAAWDTPITAVCEWCGKLFEPPQIILETISALTAHLTPDQAPCIALPKETWDDPRLLSNCPNCHRPLRFNPFLVDNRDRCGSNTADGGNER